MTASSVDFGTSINAGNDIRVGSLVEVLETDSETGMEVTSLNPAGKIYLFANRMHIGGEDVPVIDYTKK